MARQHTGGLDYRPRMADCGNQEGRRWLREPGSIVIPDGPEALRLRDTEQDSAELRTSQPPKRPGRRNPGVEFPLGRIVTAKPPRKRHYGEIIEGVPDDADRTRRATAFIERTLRGGSSKQ